MDNTDPNPYRQHGIGSSDAAASLGLSKWKTPLELWEEKRGLSERKPATWDMLRGIALEPEIRAFHEQQLGHAVTLSKTLQSERHPFMFYSPDGLLPESKRIAEYKSARWSREWGEPDTDAVPEEYLLQCQHGLIVTGWAVCELYVSIGAAEPVRYIIEADKELQEMIVAGEADFMQLVKDGIQPEPVNEDDLRRLYRKSVAKEVDADSALAQKVAELKSLKDTVREAENRMDELRPALLEYMRDADTLVYQGATLLTYKQSKPSHRFDAKALQMAEPEIYRKYLKEQEGSRRLLIK